MKTRKTIELTVEEAASEFGIDRRTLQSRLTQATASPNKRGKFSIQQCHRAIFGDIDGEKLREKRHQANILELEEQEMRRESVAIAKVEERWGEVFVALRQAVWNCDAPELSRRRWLAEIQSINRDEYFKTAKPIETDNAGA